MVATFMAMLPALLAFSALASAAPEDASCGKSSTDKEKAFDLFIQEHQRNFTKGTEEYSRRQALFFQHFERIQGQNCKIKQRWSAAVNRFSDRAPEELAAMRGYNRHAKSDAPVFMDNFMSSMDVELEASLPREVSWKNLNAVKEIQDQEQCGSCWAFASSVLLRAHSEIWREDRKFSFQELVACVHNPHKCGGTGGCEGATGELAMDYVMKHGCRTEEEFPYQGVDTACPRVLDGEQKSVKSGLDLGMTGWFTLPSNKQLPMMRNLVQRGPLAVAAAVDDNWFYYSSGVMDSCSTADPVVNHLVVLIGYGTWLGEKYWEIQNSWGTSWGDAGYAKIIRTDDEDSVCGMDDRPQEGIACEGEVDPVKVCGSCGILYDSIVPIFGSGSRLKEPLMPAATRFLRSASLHSTVN